MNTVQALLYESSFDPWESVSAALKAASGHETPHMRWLVEHLAQTKQGYWQAIGQALDGSALDGSALDGSALDGSAPPHDLPALLAWETKQAALLSSAQLQTPLEYSLRALTVAELLRLNARHSTWHAGQLAALARNP